VKLISWNVNGLRACVRKGFLDYFTEQNADIFCVQETKLQEGQIELQLEGYHQYWNYALKKGYSGTAVFTKEKPIAVTYGVGDLETEDEGRILTLEFPHYFLVNVYVPNAQRDLARLPYRLDWEKRMRNYLIQLNRLKPVIFCGDLNVAHQEIDIRNYKSNVGNSGFTFEERQEFTALLDAGFIDTYRYLHPDVEGAYTWWSYMRNVRERNIGWRIDYFLITESLLPYVRTANIHADVMGSDHCPIVLEMDFRNMEK
jgi:exodeoxyribonuclease III